MKKIILALCTALLVSTLWTPAAFAQDSLLSMAQAEGYPATEDSLPKGSIVVDMEHGQILWEDGADVIRDPASTTKVMVVYLTVLAMQEGRISMDTEIVATEQDQAISEIYALSNNHLVAGEAYTVSEIMYMIFLPSSNAATVMLAHAIFDGTDAEFIQLMNDTAAELGMTNTTFYNGTGAAAMFFGGYYEPDGIDPSLTNETTARDLAILAYNLLSIYPEILQFTGDREVTINEGTYLEETFHTYNHSLPGTALEFEGVDGLKTGSSPTAGYNSIITAKRGDTRLICVVLGASEWGTPGGEEIRHYYVNTLLDHGFSDFKREVVIPAGEWEYEETTYIVPEDIYGMVSGDSAPDIQLVENNIQYKNSLYQDLGIQVEEKKSFGWLFTILGIVAAVAVLLGIVILILRHRNKKRARFSRNRRYRR